MLSAPMPQPAIEFVVAGLPAGEISKAVVPSPGHHPDDLAQREPLLIGSNRDSHPTVSIAAKVRVGRTVQALRSGVGRTIPDAAAHVAVGGRLDDLLGPDP